VPCSLLDEPFTALDPQGVKIIEHCISKHGKQGGQVHSNDLNKKPHFGTLLI
jgi:ABC-type transport system involved in cytochrome c biogenesis ATPase subunit